MNSVDPNGKYALVLGHTMGPSTYELVQRGDVPADAWLIHLNGSSFSSGGSFTVSMDGVLIVNGDVSAFAGKNVELKIRSREGPAASAPSSRRDASCFPRQHLLFPRGHDGSHYHRDSTGKW